MEKSMLSFLRMSPMFARAYSSARLYVLEHINPYVDTLELSEDSECNICFPIDRANLYVLGLDVKKQTVWVFYDTNLADA